MQLFAWFPLLQAQGGAGEEVRKSLLEHIVSGGPIGFLIILLSFVLVALVVVHLIQIRAGSMAPPGVVSGLDAHLARNDVKGALAYCQAPENDSFLTRMFSAALTRCSRSPFGFLELRSALEEAGQQQVSRLYRTVDGIGLIAAVAPMMGLLGTVVGMVGAFDKIAASQGFARPDDLAGSISVALITTVLGLTVAIPATALYSFFRNRIDAMAGRIAEITEDLSAHLESAGGGQDRRAAPGAEGARPGGRPAAPAGGTARPGQPAAGAPATGAATR